jgi:hypothetical protein
MDAQDWQQAKKKRYVNPKAQQQQQQPVKSTNAASSSSSSSINTNEVSELFTTFSFWFFRKEKGVEDYDKNLRKIADFHTVSIHC